MALVAGNGNVFALQRVLGCVVFFHAEERGFPSLHGMTFRALALFRASFELSFVGIGLVTVRTISKRQGLLKISVPVAFRTAHHGILPDEPILCLRVVEFKARKQFFPSLLVVTLF